MIHKVMLRTVSYDGSHVAETRKVISTKHTRAISRSRMGGGSVFRRSEAAYAKIERAIDGNRRWGGR